MQICAYAERESLHARLAEPRNDQVTTGQTYRYICHHMSFTQLVYPKPATCAHATRGQLQALSSTAPTGSEVLHARLAQPRPGKLTGQQLSATTCDSLSFS